MASSLSVISWRDEAINRILTDTAGELMHRQAEVLAVNEKDLSRMDPATVSYTHLDVYKRQVYASIYFNTFYFYHLSLMQRNNKKTEQAKKNKA